MKRKQLQALCKQHGVPANSTNLEMADRLSLFFKEKEKPVTQGRSCLKNLDGIDSLNDSNAVTCDPKRVRFSPENETFEFEDSEIDRENTPARTRAARAARRSRVRLAKEKVSPVGANAGNSESCEETKGTLNRITRHRGQKVIEGHAVKASSPLVKEKGAKKGTKIKSTVSEIVDKSAKLSPVLEMDDNARGKENGRPIRRQLRSREVVVENASELGNEDSIIPKKNPVQTRSKRRNPKDSNEVLTTDEISEDIISEGEGEKIETGKVFRQSKRKAIEDGECELFGGELGKRKTVGRITRFRAQLVGREASAVEGENETGDESEVQVSKDSEAVLQLKEPAKLGRNTLRQKSAISQSDPSVRTETRKQWKGTSLEGGASETEVSMKEKEKVSLPNGPLRRSRRNTLAFKSTVSPDGGLVTHEAVGRNQQLKHLGEPITEKEASKPEATAEILKENEKVSLHNGRLRRSRRNTSTFKSSAPAADGNLVTDETVGRNEQSKCLRESTPEKEASVTEAPLRRSKRNASRHDSISASTGMDGIPNAIGKNKPQKRSLQPILEEETSVIEKEPLIEELPRQSKYNASKCNIVGPARVAGEVKGKKKQRRRSKFPSSKGEAPLTESMLDIEETPGIDVELSEPEAAGSKSSVLIHQEGTPKDKDTSKKRKSSRKISSAKKQQHGSVEVCPVISDLEEVEDRTTVNFKDIPSQSAAAIEEDIVEDLTTVNLEDIPSQSAVSVEEDISMENDKENLVQDKVNEGNKVDKESQFHNMRSDLDYDNSVEPQGNQYSIKVSKELVSPVFDFSSVQQPDYTGSSANHVKLQRELETEEELSAGKHIDPASDIFVDLAAEDDKTSVEKEQKLGLGEMNGCAEPVMHELEENVTESNESGSSKRNFETFSEESGDIALLNPSNGERATPNISGRRDIDDAEDPEAAVEFPENAVASPVAEIVAEQVTEIQLASSGQWSTEETPVKIVITPECQNDKVVGSCLHTVSADDGSQEEGYQLNAQLAAQSPVLGRSNPNHGEGEKSYSYGNVIMDGTMCGGELSVSDARERREHPVLDELDGQISEKKESVMSKGITSVSKEIKETDVSHLDFLFGTASGIVERSLPSCEHAHLKDKGEEDQDPMEQDEESTHVTEMASTTISAGKTSSNNLGSGRFHHEKYQEDAGVGESDHEGISNMGNQSLDVNEDIYNEASKGNLEVEITGLDGCAYPFPNKFSKDDHATVDNESGGSHVYSRNASGEGRGTNVVELSVGEGMPPGVSIMDKTGNASGEVEGTNVDEPSFEGITPAILEERVIAETRDFEEADKLLEFNAESHVTPGSTAGDMEKEIYFAEITQCSGGSGFDLPLSHVYALEHQASGNVHKKMSLSTQSPHVQKQEGNQLETFCVNEVLSQQTSGVKSFTLEALAMSSPPLFLEKLYGHEEEDSETNCNANTVVDEPFSKHSVVTLDGIDGKGIEEHICVTSSNLVTKKESAEVLPEIEVGNVHDDHHVVVEQMNYNVDASSAERNCKDNKMSDEAIAGFSSVGYVTLVPGEKISEFEPGTELGDSQEVTAQANIIFDASLDEIICKESEALEKTTAGIKKSTLEGIEEITMLEEENGEISAPITQTKLDREVLDQGVEFIKINGSAQVTLVETVHENDEVPEEILDEVTSEKMILLPMEADFDCNEMNIVGVKNEISLQRDELKSIDLDIHDAKDKSIFINSDQCSSADRETIDEREHSRILECKFNFEGNCSDTKHTDVGASPLISLKDFDDQIEDEEVAHMHDSDHCLSLDLLSNNSRIAAMKTHKTIAESVMLEAENGEAFTPFGSEGLGQEVSDHGVEFPNSAASDVSQAVHEADENLDTKSDGGVEMIWKGDEVKFGELDDSREEVLPETDKSSLIVPHELTSTDGEAVNGTMKENSHFEDVNFDSMKEEDVSNSPKVTAGNCDDLLEEESADVKHNGRDVQIDLNCRDIGGAADLVVEDGMVCEIGSDDRNGDNMWVQKAQTSPCKVDDGNISSSKPEGDSISASVSLLNVSSCQGSSSKTEIKELIEVVPNDEINDTNEAAVCSPAPVDFYEDKGDTLNFVGKSSEVINITKERGIAEESSAGKAEEVRGSSHKFDDEMVSSGDSKEPPKFEKFVEVSLLEAEKVDCCSVVSPVNDSVDHAEVASRKHLTRLEDTTDDSSLTHQIGVNSSLASSETASYEFTDWEIDLFSHNHFSMEAVCGTSLRIIDQFPAVTDSALYKAEDVRTENLKLETVQKKSLDVEVEEINHLSSQQFNSSMKMKNNLKSSMTQRTPNKFFKAFDMKENTPSIKMEQMGNFSAMKSGTRRKALEDLQKTRERNSTAR